MMSAGGMDRFLGLRHRVSSRTLQNEELLTWPANYTEVWARKRDIRGSKRFAAREFEAEQLTEFQIYWRSDILSTDRIYLDTFVYEILQIAEIGRREGLDLLCQAIIP